MSCGPIRSEAAQCERSLSCNAVCSRVSIASGSEGLGEKDDLSLHIPKYFRASGGLPPLRTLQGILCPTMPLHMESMDGKYILQPMTDAILTRLYDSDQAIYPSPLSLAQLREVVRSCPPEFSPCCFAKSKDHDELVLIAALIVFPLDEISWRALIRGQLLEMDLKFPQNFHISGSGSVGLHGFHAEKFNGHEIDAQSRDLTRQLTMSVVDACQRRGYTLLGLSGKHNFYV